MNRIAFRRGEDAYLDSEGYPQITATVIELFPNSSDDWVKGYEHRSVMSTLVTERCKLEMLNGWTIKDTHPLWGNHKS